MTYIYICTCRIIEVEPSVNTSSGGEIVQVLDNRIIGRIEQKSDGPSSSISPGKFCYYSMI